jgi:type II secretory pathway component PulJ
VSRLVSRPVSRPESRTGSRPGRDDRGLGLVETLIATALASIVLVAVGTVFTGAIRVVRTVSVKTATGAEVRVGLEAMTRTLRTAVRPKGESAAVLVADSSRLSFYALLNRSGAVQATDTVPTRLDYSYDGACLNQTQTPGVAVVNPAVAGPFYTWTGTSTTVCLVRTATAPQFSYFATAEIATSGTDNPALTIPSGGITATTDLGSIQSVQLLVTGTDARNPGVGGVQVLGRATLNNVLDDAGAP